MAACDAPPTPHIDSVIRAAAGLASLGTRVLEAPPLSYVAPDTLAADALVIDCVGLFITRQVSQMNAVLHLSRLGLPYASLSICRTMLELGARFAWLVGEDDVRAAKVEQWYGTVWIDEYRRHHALDDTTADTMDELRARALGAVGEYMSLARAEELALVLCSEGPLPQLKGYFRPYGGRTLRAMMADAFGE